MSEPSKRSEDWPTDEEKELLQFAEQLQAALPTLPRESLARVEQRVHDELDRQERRPTRFRRVWACSAAAVILLSLSLGAYLLHRSGTFDDSLHPKVAQKNEQPVPPGFVEDRLTVAVGAGGAPVVEKPLLQVEKYRSLFTN